MAPKPQSAAELALQKKYELLKKKKEQAARGSSDPKQEKTTKNQTLPSTAKPATAPTNDLKPGLQDAQKTQPPVKKILLIPKRNVQAPDSAPQQREQQPVGTTAAAVAPKTLKRPTQELKRPTIKRRTNLVPSNESQPDSAPSSLPASQQQHNQPESQQQPPPQPQHAKQHQPEAYSHQQQEIEPYYQNQQQYGDEWKNQASQEEYAQQYHHQQQATVMPSEPKLLVSNLPSHYSEDMLASLFSDFGQIVDAQVMPGFSSGFVTFSSFDEAQAMLDFQVTQPIELEDRQLVLSWATADTEAFAGLNTGYAVGDIDPHGQHPQRVVARTMAQQIAQQIDDGIMHVPPPARDLVVYDDL